MAEEDQVAVRVAWLYYMEGLTQDAIATRLGLTRLRVNRLLGEARESGLVSIKINSRHESCLRLEEELREACSLREAVIIPTPGTPELIPVLLGRTAGEYLSKYLENHSVRGIGVGWGATLRESIRHVTPGQWPEVQVNSMMGGLTRGLEINTFETASALATRLGAQCSYLAAPLYAGSAKSRDTIVSQDVFKEAFGQIAANDVALLSVGDLSTRSLLVRYGLPKDVPVAELKQAKAVGDIIGQFVDRHGKPVKHALNQRVVAPSIAELARIPTVIVASGGENKAPVIAAVLWARLASVLICDEQTARAALKLYEALGER